MSWVALWKFGATPQLNTGLLQESGRVGQLTLSGKFAKFRMKPVLGEPFMLLGCVILEGGGNAD